MATNVRISGSNPGDPREESDIRYNYNNLDQIICASTHLGGDQPMSYSTNGGTTWLQSSLPGFAGDARQGDPTIDWTSNGTAWSVTIGISPTTQLVLRTYKSTNAGGTWAFDSTVTNSQDDMDKEAFWIDHTATSPYKDNMYLIWHNGSPCYVSVRAGPGGTWSAPKQISGAETTGTAIGGDIKTNTYGDVFAFWPDTGSQNLFVAKSTNGGSSFGAPVGIASTVGSFTIGVPAQDDRRVLIYVSGGAYRTPTENLVYAVWTDLAGGAGCNFFGDEPGTDVTSTCKTRIWFARSTTGGATWNAPVQLNGSSSLNDQFFPRLAVDDTSGDLMVVYYDTINDPGRLQAEIWMQTSTDSGVTWSAPAQVATAETNETATSATLDFQYGDYIGLTGHSGQFFACWTDRRSGGSEEIWGAPLAEPGLKIIKELKVEIKELKSEGKDFKEAIHEGPKYLSKEVIPDKIVSYENKLVDVKTEDVLNPGDPGYGYIGDPDLVGVLAARIDQIEESLAKLQSFITADERPPLGEEALKKAEAKKEAEKKGSTGT